MRHSGRCRRSGAVAALLLVLLLPAGCATGGSAAAASTASDLAAGGGVAPIGRAEATSVRLAPQEPDHSSSELGPEILLPPPDSTDQEVARVGELSLTRSHAFARLMLADPKLALDTGSLLMPLLVHWITAVTADELGARAAARAEAAA